MSILRKLSDFVVFDSFGGHHVSAKTAEHAIKKHYAPLGFKDVRGVISLQCIAHTRARGPFVAYVGQPAEASA